MYDKIHYKLKKIKKKKSTDFNTNLIWKITLQQS